MASKRGNGTQLAGTHSDYYSLGLKILIGHLDQVAILFLRQGIHSCVQSEWKVEVSSIRFKVVRHVIFAGIARRCCGKSQAWEGVKSSTREKV